MQEGRDHPSPRPCVTLVTVPLLHVGSGGEWRRAAVAHREDVGAARCILHDGDGVGQVSPRGIVVVHVQQCDVHLPYRVSQVMEHTALNL